MITLEELHKICPTTKIGLLATFIEPLNDAMKEFEIDLTPVREAAFLAQVAHESGGFFYVREIATGSAYDDRVDLGNTKAEAIDIAEQHGSSAGRWWRGHGLIQITGYDNHLRCGDALSLDLLHQPELLEEPVNAARSAGWFWNTRGLNDLADRGDFKLITKRINGGYNGYQERVTYWERAQEALA